ncbi:MAG: ParB/RepB/Spo0J family partition protein [Pseudolabrys sp.]|nr:ParB/RepB/Spo0J family partition protein [Pseudolabrys sp.]
MNTNTNNQRRGNSCRPTDPSVEVPLSELICDERSQIRSRVDTATVTRYADAMRSGAELPPISVAVVNGAPFLIDGWHRVAAAKSIGRTGILAILLDARPEHHAWLAAQENMKNGLPLRRGEARAVFKAYVHARQHRKRGGRVKSSREIASDLNGLRSHATILKWMGQDFPRIRGMMRQEESSQREDASLESEQDSHEDRMLAETLGYLEEARKLCRGIQDPVRRGEMIAEAEAIVAAMKVQGDWVPFELGF